MLPHSVTAKRDQDRAEHTREMTELEISLPDTLNTRIVPAVVEQGCARTHLRAVQRTTLKKYP